MRALPLFHRIAARPVIVVGAGAAAQARQRLVERAGGIVVGADNPDARLAFVTGAEPEAITARLRAQGVLVNVADRPELCDFTMPSLLDREPVLLAVGTDGASAGLAKQLRLRLEALLPADLGSLAAALERARGALRARWPDAAERRRALDAALTGGGPLDPLRGGASDRIEAWLSDEDDSAAAVAVIELMIASDDPDELTLRQARQLGTADAVLFEAGVADAILDRARADAVRLPLPHDAALPGGLVLLLRRT